MGSNGLDAVDDKILAELGRNSRIPASELASIVGLTRQAVTERMERLALGQIIETVHDCSRSGEDRPRRPRLYRYHDDAALH